jgi:hypothetical protein
MPDVPMVSRINGMDEFAARPFRPASDFHAESVESGKGSFEVIDSVELATRWQVPESWIRNHTRAPTPKEGRYVRFG